MEVRISGMNHEEKQWCPLHFQFDSRFRELLEKRHHTQAWIVSSLEDATPVLKAPAFCWHANKFSKEFFSLSGQLLQDYREYDKNQLILDHEPPATHPGQ